MIDSSVAGLGGCPYAKAPRVSEDVVYLLNGLGIETSIDLDKLTDTSTWITEVIEGPNCSKVGWR